MKKRGLYIYIYAHKWKKGRKKHRGRKEKKTKRRVFFFQQVKKLRWIVECQRVFGSKREKKTLKLFNYGFARDETDVGSGCVVPRNAVEKREVKGKERRGKRRDVAVVNLNASKLLCLHTKKKKKTRSCERKREQISREKANKQLSQPIGFVLFCFLVANRLSIKVEKTNLPPLTCQPHRRTIQSFLFAQHRTWEL